jgi:Fungal Zn(2)-Cys(6) binuclear cluster domain
MSSVQRRTTQRAPRSCVFCTRRKIRCSKTLPCSNCVGRGVGNQCHRESVLLSNQRLRNNINAPTRSDTSPEALTGATSPLSTNGDRSVGSPNTLKRGRSNIHIDKQAKIVALETNRLSSNLISDTQRGFERFQHAPSASSTANTQSINSNYGHNEGNLAIEAAMSLESLAWGTHREKTNVLPSPAILALVGEVHALIDTSQALAILKFHRTHVAWMHNVVYMPIFIRECEAFLHGKSRRDPAWLSLYCAVITVSIPAHRLKGTKKVADRG